LYEFVQGESLASHCEKHPAEVTLPFIENLLQQILLTFHAMKAMSVTHGDLHDGNVLIAMDPRFPGRQPRIKIADFGIGSTSFTWQPKDDYYQLALICRRLLEKYVDPAVLTGEDRRVYDFFVNQFLKQIVETDPNVGEFVRNPEQLMEILEEIVKAEVTPMPQPGLQHPFDYLSCEQIGDSFELLQLLYSSNFPGYSDLTERSNTILTGPRGCGKTTIFRNLSVRTQVLAGKLDPTKLPNFVGVYYQCSDLYYAFPNLKDTPTAEDQKAVTHYFNLAISFEVLDTFSSIRKIPSLALTSKVLSELEGFLRGFMPGYSSAPAGTDLLKHLKSVISSEKSSVKRWLDAERTGPAPENFLPMDFLKRLCRLLQENVLWLKGRPFYFFIDDYSLPRISKAIQTSLGNFILDRYSECFFKISTESATTIWPIDSHGKMLEETREYDMVDLGDYFLQASPELKQDFLRGVVNQRLRNAVEKRKELEDIASILGRNPYNSYVELALAIRDPSKRVLYCGWELIVDLCSGDIAIILRLVRDIFSLSRDQNRDFRIADQQIQDRAIRENSNGFLNRIEAAPETGPRLRKIAEAFGDVANWYLRMLTSGNQENNPPWLAFRVEVRSRPELKGEALKLYQELIRYGVFLRDVRGKSQRGAVVPRLYLRRLLIPTFKITPSMRDNIGLNPDEFVMMLTDPAAFSLHMKKKPRRVRADRRQTKFPR
jgi:serine/threonine protein kinase